MARIINFEGRTLSLPDDATDEEVAEVLSSSAPGYAPPNPSIIEVEAPDGTIVEFPQGTPRDVIVGAMRKRFGGPSALPAASAEPVVAPEPQVETTADELGNTIMLPPRSAPAPAAGGGLSARVPAALAAPTRGALTEGLAVASQVPQGVREGFSNLLGLPVDTLNAVGGLGAEGIAAGTNAVLRALGLPEGPTEIPAVTEPLGGSKSIDRALRAPAMAVEAVQDATGVQVFGKPEAPTGAGGRMLRRVGEEVGAAAIPVGAAVRAGKMGVERARELPALLRTFVEPAAIKPGRFAIKELGTAVAAGTGAGAANEATRSAGVKEGSPNHNAADMAGAFGGVGVAGVGKALLSPVKNIVGAATGNPKFADQVIRDNVVDEVMRASGAPNERGADAQPLVDTIMRGRKVGDTIPGFQESLADRTGSPGIAALEYSRSGGSRSGTFAQRRSENTNAIDRAMDVSAPNGSPGALRSELEVERGRRLTDAGVQTQNAQGALDAHVQRLQPAMTAEGRGADLRAALEGASAETRSLVRQAWEPINHAEHRVDVGPLVDRFDQVGQRTSRAENLEFRPAVADMPAALAEEGAQPLRELAGIRSVLSARARGAATPQEARVINQYIDALDAHTDTVIPADLRGQYDTARAATRDMKDRFARPQTAIAQALDRQQGQPRMPASDVAAKFVQSDEGKIADFQALMREAGGDARVVPAVRDQILSDVSSRRLLDNPAELEAYIGRYNTILSEPRFAGVREELGTAAGLRRALDGAAGNEATLTRELGTPDRPGTGNVGKYLQFGDERAEDAMRGVLVSKQPGAAADELLRFVNDDPASVEGARQVFWNIMQKRARSGGETTVTAGGAQPWQPRALKGFLDDPATSAVAERIYRENPEHLANIREIADALQNVNLAGRARAPNTSGTGQAMQSILPSFETLASRAFAVKRGVVGIPFTAVNIVGIMARRATGKQQAVAFERAMDKALLDPDWAAMLLKENNPANRAAFEKGAKLYLGNEAATLAEMLNSERERDPTTEAIMR